MADERKLSSRDETLIKVLDRLSDNIWKQELLLDEVIKQQHALTSAMERAGMQLQSRHDTSDAAFEKTRESFTRYRSDMLSLVGEQDRMNDIIKDLSKKQAAIAFTQDNIVNSLTSFNERFETQDKIIRDINTHSIKHEETLSREITEMSRNVARLHSDTEKSIGAANSETKRQINKVRKDSSRLSKMLYEIEASVNVLLIRTEPPEKRPFFIIRLFRSLRRSLKNIRQHNVFEKIRIRRTGKKRHKD